MKIDEGEFHPEVDEVIVFEKQGWHIHVWKMANGDVRICLRETRGRLSLEPISSNNMIVKVIA